MPNGQMDHVLGHLRRLVTARPARECPDPDLLARFVAGGDQAAFAAILERHGPLVLGVCRRVLHREQDAEDACQATFLALARQAASIRKGESLGSWLHGVAGRVARGLRADRRRRAAREAIAASAPCPDAATDLSWREALAVLDEELGRLPGAYRAVLVACYLEGRTHDEAARELGLSVGALRGRLERARALLRRRLTRRGIGLSAGLLAAVLAEQAAAAVPPPLVTGTVRAAAALVTSKALPAGVVPAHIDALAQGAVRAMNTSRIKWVLALLVGVSVAVVGAVAHRGAEEPGTEPPGRPAGPDRGTDATPAGRMTVAGKVLDAIGRPVPEARVAVLAAPFRPQGISWTVGEAEVLGQARCDGDGRFRLAVPQTSSGRHHLVRAVAAAPGHGLVEAALDPDAAAQETTLRLLVEWPVTGTVRDSQGRPAAGVRIDVLRIGVDEQEPDLGYWLARPAKGFEAWPAPATSDAQGRFFLRGVGTAPRVMLRATGAGIGPHEREFVPPVPGAGLVDLAWALAPAQVLAGRVMCADSNKPVPHARLEVLAYGPRPGPPNVGAPGPVYGPVEGRADEQGRFRLTPPPGVSFRVTAYPPAGEPYVALTKSVPWPEGAARQDVDVALPRGVHLRGVVREAPSGKPVDGAGVRFCPAGGGLFDFQDPLHAGWEVGATSGPDGTFHIAVAPGRGHLLVKGPTPDYVHVDVSFRKLLDHDPGQDAIYHPDGVVPLDLKAGTEGHRVEVTLRRGVTVRGRLVDLDDRPVPRALLWCPTYVPVGHVYAGHPVTALGGRFEVPGCDPKGKVRVVFYDAQGELGAAAELAGAEAERGPVTVRLDRCGAAEVRFLDGRGRPQAGYTPTLQLVLRPAAPPADRRAADIAHVWDHVRGTTDADGVVTLRPLIPGATYRFVEGGRFPGDDFTVPAGRTVNLGEVALPGGR
jgi:RNA polymerase sigma factor (sigma-70 family)